MFSKIVRIPILEEEPVVIKAEKHHNADSEEAEEDSGFDEETLKTMLAEIAAKEQRAIQKLKDANT
ncbi:MAG: flagellar assembly protein FliH, partial [Selenomonadaceae bacterium]|nr:flagellar assembly protein FliH [Selenomonadaceae bacterium]